MDTNPSLVNLLNSQIPFDLESGEPWFSSQGSEDETAKVIRRQWTPNEDKILIGAWLNTSKDAVVANDQKAQKFWQRIADYYNSHPSLVGTTPRGFNQCKQRWYRINEQVCKFVGCFDTAMREQRSGHSDDDLMKAALDIFFNDYGHKFALEHAWRELRHDQKWCTKVKKAKDSGKEKRKQPVVDLDGEEQDGAEEVRPMGVKACKAAIKRKKSGKEEEFSHLEVMMQMKEKISQRKLLERLLAKREPLSEMETSLKMKLMSELI